MRAPRTCVHYNAVCTHGTHVHTTHTHHACVRMCHTCTVYTPHMYMPHTCKRTMPAQAHTTHMCAHATHTHSAHAQVHTSHTHHITMQSVHTAYMHTPHRCAHRTHTTHMRTHTTLTVSLSGPFSRPAPRLLDSVHPLVSTSPVGREGGDSHPGGLWLLQGSGQRDRSRCQGLGAGWVPRTVGVVAGRGRL